MTEVKELPKANAELIKVHQTGLGEMDIKTAKEHYSNFNKFKKEICKVDVDYGTIPGTQKPTLYKAGAEKLIKAFRLFTTVEEVSKTMDLDIGFIDFEYKVYVKNIDGMIVGEGVGSCNSFEDKYLYTGWKATTEKPSETDQYQLKANGLGRFRKKYGTNKWEWCQREKKPNTALIAQKNTIQKIAKKRAFVDACLMATGGGEFFTQDIEDMDVLPDLETVLDELRQVLKFALKNVTNRSELTDLYKSCTVLHKEEGVHNDFKSKGEELPEEK